MRQHNSFYKTLLLSLLGCSLSVSSLHAENNFDGWKRQQMSDFEQSKNEFEKYKREIKAALKEYKRKTAGIWGRDNVIPDKTNWVSYIDDLDQRSVVDFENGSIEVEVAIPADQSIDDNQARKKLEQTLIKAMKMGDDKRPIQQIAQQPVSQPDNKAVLQGQISMPGGTTAKPDDYVRLAQQSASNANKKTLRGDDGKTRIVYQANLRLVPEHIRIRASKYQPLVEKYAAQHNMPVPVIFAVIETESMFNPTARSGAPAFGLMQLVPTSGARDAYKYLYNKDKVVTDTYLYNPENNIRLGSAYLLRINTGYLDGIKSDQSRMLATIAAYNTGSGNVLKAFAGRYNSAKHGSYSSYKKIALGEINRRTPEQVYQYLRSHLPYKETRDYIKKVTERMNKYTVNHTAMQ